MAPTIPGGSRCNKPRPWGGRYPGDLPCYTKYIPPRGQWRPPGDAGVDGGRTLGWSKVSGLLEHEEVLGRELLAFLEPLEDEFRLFLRVDLFRDFFGDAAALHPDAVNDLVVIVDLADVLDVLAVFPVREHLRLDELLLRPVGLPAQVVALLVAPGHLVVLRLALFPELGDALVSVFREVSRGL